ncbi:hypothetical protein E2C01_038123 [Portunus trituberculatus]|uniref:Uncharacterized protein n=1 Tax=Portunus trituberculatus TaxID=210409 RepID=A0A5B7FA03_PORTR|nr:hypothetical protein [Portunus trituberculatus]
MRSKIRDNSLTTQDATSLHNRENVPRAVSGTSGSSTSGFSAAVGASGSCFWTAAAMRASSSSSTADSSSSVNTPPLRRALISCRGK